MRKIALPFAAFALTASSFAALAGSTVKPGDTLIERWQRSGIGHAAPKGGGSCYGGGNCSNPVIVNPGGVVTQPAPGGGAKKKLKP